MASNFKLEIVTPEKTIFTSEVDQVTIPSYEGEMTILKDHIALVTFLRPGIIKILSDANQEFFVEDGTVEFSNNNLLILTSTAKSLDSLEKNSIDIIIKTSEEKLSKDEISDKEKRRLGIS